MEKKVYILTYGPFIDKVIIGMYSTFEIAHKAATKFVEDSVTDWRPQGASTWADAYGQVVKISSEPLDKHFL